MSHTSSLMTSTLAQTIASQAADDLRFGTRKSLFDKTWLAQTWPVPVALTRVR